MLFQDLPLSEEIKKGINALNHQKLTPIQELAISEILRRNDVLAGAPTGTGKTGAFAIPLLQLLHKKKEKSKKTELSLLIISPTRELAVQLEKDFAAYAYFTSLKTGVVFGGTSLNPQIEILKNGLDILVATPGRLLDLRKQGYIDLEKIKVLVLDEADLLLDMGFIDEIRKIIRLSTNLEQRLMFSATLPPKVEDLAKTFLENPERLQIDKDSSLEKGIQPFLYYVSKPDKTELLLFVMRNIVKEQSVLIFRRTKFGVEKTAQALTKNGFSNNMLHGDKSQSERSLALNDFRNGNVKILVATDVAARGLDITGLDYVINFDIPNVPETYVHRVGRTARAGESGTAISFCSADERDYIKNIEKSIDQKLPVAEENPFLQDKDEKPPVHKKKGSKHKKGRKGSGSKAKKKRWY